MCVKPSTIVTVVEIRGQLSLHPLFDSVFMGEQLNNKTNNKTISWVNIVKCIGVYLVFLGHTLDVSNEPFILRVICSFHMPLFFILSGYLFKFKETDRFGLVMKRKTMRILVPAIFFNIIWFPFAYLVYEEHNISYYIKRLFLVEGRVGPNDPCWFLFVLFIIYLIAYDLHIHKNSVRMNIAICIASFSIGYILYSSGFSDYFCVIKVLVALGFFTFGKVMSVLDLDFILQYKVRTVLFIIASFGVWEIFGIQLNPHVSFYFVDFGNYHHFIIAAIAGTFCLCLTTALLCSSRNKVTNYLSNIRYPSKASIFILCTQYMPLLAYKIAGAVLLFDNGKYTLYNIIAPFAVLVMLIVYYPVYKVLSDKLPIITGDFNSSKKEGEKKPLVVLPRLHIRF